MILELTIENLLKSGCNETDANELYNTKENYTLSCNSGNFYVSKTENKFYTGIDFYRIIYFNIDGLKFPYNYPDLVNEYFDLALIEFKEKQKNVLGLLFNEKDQFNKFVSNEIERTQKRMISQKEFLLKMKHHKFERKENDIQICESYINYLKAKQQPQQSNDIIENPYPFVFVNVDAYNCFKDYTEKHILEFHLDYSYLKKRLEKEKLIHNHKDKDFAKFLFDNKFISESNYGKYNIENKFNSLNKTTSTQRENNFNNVFEKLLANQ